MSVSSAQTHDLDAMIRQVTDKGVHVLGQGTKIGAHGNPVVFLEPRETGGVLIELEHVRTKTR